MCASPHVQKLSVAVRNYHQLDQAISQVNLITTTFIRKKKKHFKLEVQPVKPSRPHSTVACGYTDMRSGVFWGCIQSQTWLILNDGSSSTAECTLTFCDRRLLTDDTGRHPSLRLEARQRQKRFISVRITSLFRTTWYIMFAYDTCSDFQPTKIEWGRDHLSQLGYCVIL